MIGLLVAVAGAAGASARVLVERAVGPPPAGRDWPWASYVVNPLGSLAAGIVAGLVLEHGLADEVRQVVGTGFLGAFTVVGPVTVDSVRLRRAGAPGLGALNVVAGTLVPVVAAAVGLAATGAL